MVMVVLPSKAFWLSVVVDPALAEMYRPADPGADPLEVVSKVVPPAPVTNGVGSGWICGHVRIGGPPALAACTPPNRARPPIGSATAATTANFLRMFTSASPPAPFPGLVVDFPVHFARTATPGRLRQEARVLKVPVTRFPEAKLTLAPGLGGCSASANAVQNVLLQDICSKRA